MKFGKRLAAEANRRAEWSESFVDYKRLKRATKLDIGEAGEGDARAFLTWEPCEQPAAARKGTQRALF